MNKRIRFRLILALTPLIVPAVRILGRSIRWKKRYDFHKDRGKIYALLHGHALGLALFGMDRGICTLASRFADGEIATRILEGLGFEVVRGSTEEGRAEKGGRTVALQLIEAIQRGKNVAITVDGPKGPPMKVKRGVVFLAQKTGAPIVPAAVKFKKFFEVRSWDRFLVPYPFTEGEVIVGEEIRVLPEDDLEEKRLQLERVLSSLASS